MPPWSAHVAAEHAGEHVAHERDGYAAIRLADSAGNLDVLAETSSPRLPLGSTASIAATRVDAADESASLSLSVDGTAVLDTRVEDPLGNGVAGLQAYDAAEDESPDRFLISWHDFTVEPSGSGAGMVSLEVGLGHSADVPVPPRH